ncbi:biogenesis of lysosome-related organelles complex 1 subunit 5 [Odontesthes bonariensis]|uniref:biogenesis of lysosome-related organelles complex 1 subunit 5 n=1 Tax=Odontesthes bonariensis TaxID=219752 RepID=UPI003F58864C
MERKENNSPLKRHSAEFIIMDKVVKDVGDIQSRLLDHRPIINAEVRYFVREFEEKRGYRESRLLENLNKMVQETNEQMLPTNLEDTSQQLSDIIRRLEAANHMAERVQQRELEAQQNTHLQANLEKVKDDWAEFLKEQQRLKEEVDEEHAKAVGEVSTRFSEKKKDLSQYSFM